MQETKKAVCLSFDIYIPIWWYSNLIEQSKQSIKSLNLHSNLVIFKSKDGWYNHDNSCIYIPIWWYSNRIFKLYININIKNLHSNLVIFKLAGDAGIGKTKAMWYSNQLLNFSHTSWLYHLHSNLVIFKFVFNIEIGRGFLFTLKSGDIQLKNCQWGNGRIENLHSNLVIFKYNDGSYENISLDKFTFQSGDIQIREIFANLSSIDIYLHSNLVIFK